VKTLKSIIVPTRNRPELLNRLVKVLVPQLIDGDELIIVDSSDPTLLSQNLSSVARVKYLMTKIRSAAVQRNIGLEHLGNSKYVFFLDDDVIPNADYFEKCINILNKSNAVGVSGVALNPKSRVLRSYPKGLIGAYHRFFLLDSMKDGVLLPSGVNVPVRNYLGDTYQVDWLIGCSGWLTEKIGDTRFESDFLGQSLSEDVIFSVRMSKKGRIITVPSIVLIHDESEIARPSKDEFWKMWMVNRYRLIRVASFGTFGVFSYWWANLGQLGILCYSKFRKQNYSTGSIKGLLTGALVILGMKK
jgi:glycosyltransferase involved in cell wall biosynthesis